MPSIPVDVLREILEHVGRADLATICQLNKICCSYSQDVLYRHIYLESENAEFRLHQTLAQSTHLAKRVRSISVTIYISSVVETIAKALRNMSSLRRLYLSDSYSHVLDGCTFRLHSFSCMRSCGGSESFRNFLRNQTSITDITCWDIDPSVSTDATCLPNLTRVTTMSLYSVSHLIPGRPVNDVHIMGALSLEDSADLSFFTLSTAPLQKLTINYSYLYPKSGELLASIFHSLKDLTMFISFRGTHPVCVSFYLFFN
jgi:hypothetical protein